MQIRDLISKLIDVGDPTREVLLQFQGEDSKCSGLVGVERVSPQGGGRGTCAVIRSEPVKATVKIEFA